MKRDYIINHGEQTITITITKAFAARAADISTKEYRELTKLHKDFPDYTIQNRTAIIRADKATYPGMRIVHKTHRSPSKANANKGLTYDRMERYINLHENADKLLDKYNAVKEIAATQKSPYLFTKGWFMKQFPDYGKLPNISSNGKILYVLPVDPPAAEKDNTADSSKTLTESVELDKAS